MYGKVKWFNRRLGYGYITGDNRKDYFVHHANIKAEGYRNLNMGESVMFNIARNVKGDLALNVIELKSRTRGQKCIAHE